MEALLTTIFKFGKLLYSTQIITEDFNPILEETGFMLVTHR